MAVGSKHRLLNLVQNALALLHNSERYQLRGHRDVATDNQNLITTTAYTCSVDGSFKMPDQGGAAYVLKHDYILVQYGLKYYSAAFSPFHMEAAALLMGLRATVDSGIDSCTFLADSEQLVHVLNTKQTPVNENSQVCKEISCIHSILSQHSCKCVHIQREGNKLAHDIANLARTKKFSDHVGFTYPLFLNVWEVHVKGN